MNTQKYLSDVGLSHFLNKLKETFGHKETIITARNVIDTYILNIDYAEINKDATLAILGTGQLGTMILGKDS